MIFRPLTLARSLAVGLITSYGFIVVCVALLVISLGLGCTAKLQTSDESLILYGVSPIKSRLSSTKERAQLAAQLQADYLVSLANGLDLIVWKAADGAVSCTAENHLKLQGVYHESVELSNDYSVIKVVLSKNLIPRQINASNGKKSLKVNGNAEDAYMEIIESVNKQIKKDGVSSERIYLKLEKIKFDFASAPPAFEAALYLYQ
jgi:hypothetical protein